MDSIVLVPEYLGFIILLFQVATIYVSYRVGNKLNLPLLNGITLAMIVGLTRRTLDYALSLGWFETIARDIRYIELAYFPIFFSAFMLMGLIQISSQFQLSHLKPKE